MPAFFYFCFDSYFLTVNLLIVVVLQAVVTLYYKDQFLFIVCLPYLHEVASSSFLVTKFGLVVHLYVLLVILSLLFVTPPFLMISGLFFFLPVFDLLNLILLLGISLFYLLGTICSLFCLFKVFLPIGLLFLVSLSPHYHHLLEFTFDLTVDSWVYTVTTLTALSVCSTGFYIFFLFSLLQLSSSRAFWVRIASFFSILFILVTFLPSDLYLHVLVLVLYFTATELPLFLRFLLIAYSGRVA